MPRNKYTNQFKSKIVLAIIRGDKEFNEICAEYNLSPGMVRKWRQQALENFPMLFSMNSNSEQKKAQRKGENLKQNYDRLLKAFGQVTLERNFLQDCFRQAGEPIPKLPGDDSDEL